MNHRVFWTVCTGALLLTSGCGEETTECGEPLYGGRATDEAWRAMVDARKKPVTAERAVTLQSPEPGQTYAADAAPPRWTWAQPSAALQHPAASGQLAVARPRARASLLSRLGELLLPSAQAHLPPFTGDLYWVQVTVPGRACPVELLTSEPEWQLDEAAWSAIGAARDTDLSLQVTSAYLLNNQVTEGPYQLAAPRHFRRAGGAK
ncbi:hypothetical protein P2318_32410 [Myxococcaceae bacterium GXIMD 01537]